MIDQSLTHLNSLMSFGTQHGGFKIELEEDNILLSVGKFSYIICAGMLTTEALLEAHVSIKSQIAVKEKWYG